jgi:hypothetical protein
MPGTTLMHRLSNEIKVFQKPVFILCGCTVTGVASRHLHTWLANLNVSLKDRSFRPHTRQSNYYLRWDPLVCTAPRVRHGPQTVQFVRC